MATHRRGTRPAQWPIRDLLAQRRPTTSGLRDPRLFAAVGGLVACGAAAAVAFTAGDVRQSAPGSPAGPMALPAPPEPAPASPGDPTPPSPVPHDPSWIDGGPSDTRARQGPPWSPAVPVPRAWQVATDGGALALATPARSAPGAPGPGRVTVPCAPADSWLQRLEGTNDDRSTADGGADGSDDGSDSDVRDDDHDDHDDDVDDADESDDDDEGDDEEEDEVDEGAEHTNGGSRVDDGPGAHRAAVRNPAMAVLVASGCDDRDDDITVRRIDAAALLAALADLQRPERDDEARARTT